MSLKTWKLGMMAMVGVLLLSGCAAGSGSASAVTSSLADYDNYQAYPLLWEKRREEGREWTRYVLHLIHNETPQLIQGADDVETFCPRYHRLETQQRVNFWALLVSGIVKYESDFNPTKRLQETTMGIDPITKQPVYSEGLMQLSYQDVRPYPFCDFDWDQDRRLKSSDPQKTILDPYKNLTCGVKILAQQIRRRGRIALSSGVYWAVLKVNGKYSKLDRIAALTKTMPGCM